MTVYAVRLPDVGEGVAEAELVEWHVSVGDHVTTASTLAEVLTDKATVEISSPVEGTVVTLHGEPGDRLAVGADFVGIELAGSAPAGESTEQPPVAEQPPVGEQPPADTEQLADTAPAPVVEPWPAAASPRATASPAVRHRARELQIDLAEVQGTGPGGRVVHADLDRHLAVGRAPRVVGADTERTEPVRGLRRRIAERLTQAWSEIPHITYVEEVDATELEALRAELNRRQPQRRVTMLPFVVRAIVVACREQPRLNARYDAANGTLSVFDAVHVGIATQTPDGLVVPVVRHAETLDVWQIGAEIERLAVAARAGTATREELGGSTITITSLGALGGLVTTPLVNQPEVAIIGVNKLQIRPVWQGGAFVPRSLFNLSSSFDHRIVDGWDAATFVQRLKAGLEMPALLFLDAPG